MPDAAAESLGFETWYRRQLDADAQEARQARAAATTHPGRWAASSGVDGAMHPEGPHVAVGDDYPWIKRVPEGVWLCDDPYEDDCRGLREEWMCEARHIERWDPTAVLAVINIKLQVLDEHVRDGSTRDPRRDHPNFDSKVAVCKTCTSDWPFDKLPSGEYGHLDVYEDEHGNPTLWPCRTLRLEAQLYSGRPGYLQVWAP